MSHELSHPTTVYPIPSGSDLRTLRENHGFTHEGLAEAAGLGVEQVRTWEAASELPARLVTAFAHVIDGEGSMSSGE